MFWRGSRPARFHLPGGDPRLHAWPVRAPSGIPPPRPRHPGQYHRGLMGAARETGDGCFCPQRHLPRMIVPGFADHDPGPGIEGMGTGALRRAGRTRRAVTGATPGRGPAFTKPRGAPSPGVRATGWHADDRTRVLPRLTGQPEPRAGLARAPRDLPCSPREPCRPGERGPLLATALLAVPMLLIHALSEPPRTPPPLRHGLPQADCAAWATAAGHHPPAAAA
jgi:hypothetical protein